MSYSTADGPENWGNVRLEGDDDLSIGGSAYVRSLGMGIEGRPAPSPTTSGAGNQSQLAVGIVAPPPVPTTRAMRRTSGMSWSSGRATVVSSSGTGHGKGRQVSSSSTTRTDAVDGLGVDNEDAEKRERQMSTCLSLLQTFHAHASFQLSVLESFLPSSNTSTSYGDNTVYLSPKDVLAFELGPLSGLDALYLEWLAREYAGSVKVVVKRGWKDLLSAIFGYA